MDLVSLPQAHAEYSSILKESLDTSDNFRSLSRGKPHSPDVNHKVVQVLTQRWSVAL